MRTTRRILFILSLLISLLLLLVSGTGIVIPEIYAAETPAWQAQCYGQDLVDLLIIFPVLIISSVLFLTGRSNWRQVWPGIILYLLYTFVIYSFAVHFNGFFVEYCLILGLSFYAMLIYVFKILPHKPVPAGPATFTTRLTGIYFILVALTFYMLWLTEIIPAIRSHTPSVNLKQSGLLTNPVHVLDLSLVLPAFLITGILLLLNRRSALQWTPSLLAFATLMNITIAILNMLMKEGWTLTLAFILLAVFNVFLLIFFIRTNAKQRTKR